MNPSLLTPPRLDPTPLFELFRGSYATELLTAAVAHFRVFDRFGGGPRRPTTCAATSVWRSGRRRCC